MPSSTVVDFPRSLPRRQPVKAQLRPDVLASVTRSLRELPRLAVRNPDAALLAGKFIHKWNHSPAEDDATPTAEQSRHANFDRDRQISLDHCTKAGHRRCAAWLAAHPHLAVGQ